ncbi:hypothetical protein [Chitinophaga sp. XS-30]|uniref:hypothetical protein n=1 Tax=Chitinophaga sp. XS-30 TaxID=2604421 RepID=UPI0011DD768F|nr:hypothetical protein [Chitinophaga sp. XS-30]QEH40710.1 hypothetical protein FW415_07415 [Chitinophaga sp. XS-30]
MKIRYPWMLLVCVTGCISCSRNIYIPNQVNAPLLHEKQQFKINVTPSSWHGAYAITDKFAVMVNGQYTWERFGGKGTGRMGHFTRPLGGVAEAGVGVFKKFSHKTRPPVVLDLYAGYGAGGFRMVEEAYYSDSAKGTRYDHTVRTRFRKFFIQPGIGMVHKRVELTFTPRFTFLGYARPYIGSQVSQTYINHSRSYQITYLPEMKKAASSPTFLYEPAFTLRVGTPHFKWHFQLQGCISSVLEPTDYYPFIIITTGISAGF